MIKSNGPYVTQFADPMQETPARRLGCDVKIVSDLVFDLSVTGALALL